MNQGTKGYSLTKKPRGESRETVPLNAQMCQCGNQSAVEMHFVLTFNTEYTVQYKSFSLCNRIFARIVLNNVYISFVTHTKVSNLSVHLLP
jgi:hypothetical protein